MPPQRGERTEGVSVATVCVTSELVETDGSETEEFSETADSLSGAVTLMLEEEGKVAHSEWFGWVAFKSEFCFDDEGFSFTIYDNGSGMLYRYAFTA